jgi:hypothetical protein
LSRLSKEGREEGMETLREGILQLLKSKFSGAVPSTP